MIRYLLKRTAIIIPTVLFLMLVVFLMMYFLPGSNPAEFSTHNDGDALDSFFEKTALHDTAVGNYIRLVADILTKPDMGANGAEVSYFRNLGLRVKFTFILTLAGLIMSLMVGFPLGVLSALNKQKAGDKIAGFFTVLFSALPPYVLAILLVLFFSNFLRLLPPFGIDRGIKSYIMPAITIGASGVALVGNMTRSAVLETKDKTFISVLRSNGVPEKKILFSHILRNTLTTVVSSLNVVVTSLLCGSLIVENFFSVPGLGQMIVDTVSSRRQRVLVISVGLISLILMLVRILSDLLCATVNPQVRARLIGKKAQK